MVRSYVVALAWAVVIIIGIWPLYQRFAPRPPARRKWFAPLAATVITAVVLVIPVFLTLAEIGREGEAVLRWIGDAQKSGVQVPDWVPRLPLLGSQIEHWWRVHLSDPHAFGNLFGDFNMDSLAAWIRSLGGELAYRLLLAFLSFLTMFLLLRDGSALGGRLLAVAEQWLGHPGERLFERMVFAVRGVVNGTVIIAMAEGFLIGIGYAIAGVPHAALFAILTAAFAMLPFGAWFAFSTAALVLLLNGEGVLATAGVFAWGSVVMLVGDNVAQPALIGGEARLPLLWTLIGILGGLETFGLVGLFLGPVIMAALLTIWRDWIERPSRQSTSD